MSNKTCYGRDFDLGLSVCCDCSLQTECEADYRTGAYREEHPDPWLDEPERAAFGRLTDYIEGRIAEFPDIRPLDADYVAGYLMELCRQQFAKLHWPTLKPWDTLHCTCGREVLIGDGAWDADDVFVCNDCLLRQEESR